VLVLFLQQKTKQPKIFYVSGRNMSSWHIGLSATDVGGAVSIGLGGLGFMGFWFMDVIHGTTFAWLSRLPYSKG
jgi:SSS family solute:Na+ symporter